MWTVFLIFELHSSCMVQHLIHRKKGADRSNSITLEQEMDLLAKTPASYRDIRSSYRD